MPNVTRADQGRMPTLKMKDQTLAQLLASAPAATHKGHIAYVSNGNGGNPGMVFSNGTNWVVLTLGATAS